MDTVQTKSFKDLIVWQQAMSLAVAAYELTRSFPSAEQFGLGQQIRRSAASVPANIAEGSSRTSKREFSQYLKIARGSLRELETHVLLGSMVGLLSNEEALEFGAKVESVGKLLTRLLRSVEAK